MNEVFRTRHSVAREIERLESIGDPDDMIPYFMLYLNRPEMRRAQQKSYAASGRAAKITRIGGRTGRQNGEARS